MNVSGLWRVQIGPLYRFEQVRTLGSAYIDGTYTRTLIEVKVYPMGGGAQAVDLRALVGYHFQSVMPHGMTFLIESVTYVTAEYYEAVGSFR